MVPLSPTTSFSVILETENLASSSLEGFETAIASLMKQDVPIESANEVIILDSGDLSTELKATIAQKYPWVRVVQPPTVMNYYEVKSYSIKVATGEVIVLCDSDCEYVSHWLRSLLAPFSEDPSVSIVAGETSIPVKGPYSTAMAVNYMLHRQSAKQGLQPTAFYYMNNVAFRRQLLLSHPLPVTFPIYRGTCSLHSDILRQHGYKIWKQPLARAYHAPPNGLQHYLWRFLVMGHDNHWLEIFRHQIALQKPQAKQLSSESEALPSASPQPAMSRPTPPRKSLGLRLSQRLNYLKNQIRICLEESPEAKWYLPLAIPIAVVSQVLVMVGRLITRYYPHYLLRCYVARFEPDYLQTLTANLDTPAPQTRRLA